jgi:hypothetical protein
MAAASGEIAVPGLPPTLDPAATASPPASTALHWRERLTLSRHQLGCCCNLIVAPAALSVCQFEVSVS